LVAPGLVLAGAAGLVPGLVLVVAPEPVPVPGRAPGLVPELVLVPGLELEVGLAMGPAWRNCQKSGRLQLRELAR